MEERICRKVIVKGRVQGIGFRYFVQRIAEEEGVCGYVRNLPDSSVEIVVETNGKTFEHFLERVKKEHPYAVIRETEIIQEAVNNYKNFHIIF